jgi:hypothetical protein
LSAKERQENPQQLAHEQESSKTLHYLLPSAFVPASIYFCSRFCCHCCCCCCHTHPVAGSPVLQQFHSKNGPAWLFGQVINVVPGPREERLMTTGMHVVSDISCTKCCALLGWKYVSAAGTFKVLWCRDCSC